MFVIDATGSMSDEIEQLKANIVSISDQLAQLPTKPDVRFATTVFRDRGDAFVTRTFDFTSDVKAFQDALRAVEADGGGDTPEAVNAAVFDAIHKPAWRGGETVSLAFLIGDAAPHLDDPDDPDYAAEVFEAAERGIKIEPIASSGLDDQGEYVFRQLAQLTGGRFSFLTYGAGGAPEPGDATTHHVKDYSVLSLDDLVVRLITEELAPLAR
jgi:Mg-chelatase subunit ChlD